MKSLLLPFVLITITSVSLLSTDSLVIEYHSPENIKRFADFLYTQNDFQRAAGEYQRYLFAAETLPVDTDSMLFRIGQCFRRGNEFDKAIHYFQNVIDDHADPDLMQQAHYQIALCYFLMDRFKESEVYLISLQPDMIDPASTKELQHLRALNMIQLKQWDNAYTTLSTIEFKDKTTSDLLQFAYVGQHLPRKSKTLAGVYSTIVPGLGKLYCNRKIDALQSFFSTAILGWQAYDGFHKDGVSSMKGWIFGTIGGLFYLGNIYGSVVAAEIYNEEHEAKLLSTIKVYLNVHFD
jgi:tetratricopeptide (TPR) repeat protein